MNILVLNGSPKGKYSITVHTVLYLEKLFPEHHFEYLDIGQKIKSYEKDFTEVKKNLEQSELIIFSYPVYTFIAPSQVHRFIELIKENNTNLTDKFVTQITTSKHFYDVTAHNYIEDNCHDLGMKVIKGLSADMEDLTSKKGQKEAVDFFKFVIDSIKNDIYEPKKIFINKEIKEYNISLPVNEKVNDKNIVLVADLLSNDLNLRNMIDDFINVTKYPVKLVNIREFNFSGGCLGCFNCAGDGKCIYKDKFDEFLRNEIQTGNAIVLAFTIKDHSMGAQFKLYDDRQFCNGHRTVTERMPFGYIINGDYEAEHNLKTVVEGRSEVGHNYLAGVGLDSNSIQSMCKKLEYAMENEFVKPRNFYGVGGMKIFRDLIWIMRGIMKADHKYYKKNGVYDFPQKQRGKMMIMCFLGALVRNKKIKAKMGNKFNEGMVAPYQKVINRLDK